MDLRCLDDCNNPIPNCLLKCLETYEESYTDPFMCLPFYKHSYQETVYQSLSFLWTEACQGMHTHVQQRMEAMENCESLPNDILGMIIRASHSDNGFDMEALVDKFMTFFKAGMYAGL